MHIGPILRAMKHNRTRVVLIVLEIAMTLAIVTNCVDVILGERAKMLQQSGFDDDNIVRVRARPFTPDFQEASFLRVTSDADVRAIQSIPGVRAVANTNFQLWEGGGSSTNMRAAGSTAPAQTTQIYFSSKDLIDTLGSKIIEGRAFIAGDHAIGPEQDPGQVAVITKTLADALFPGGRAVGQSLQTVSQAGEPTGDPVTVVGVIEHFYNPYSMPGAPREAVEIRAAFFPGRGGSYSRGLRYLVRVEPGMMNSVLPEIEKKLAAVHPGRAVDFEETTTKKDRWFSASKIAIVTMSTIVVALVLVTALGILGLTSLAVAERRKQIGTRRALGATRGDILSYFLLENWLVTTAGLILGVVGAYALNVLLVSQVADAKLGWQLLGGGMVLLWVSGLLSTIPPALRAMSVAPSIATRSV